MTVLAVSPSLVLSRLGPREAIGWGAAAVVVLAAHLLLGYGALYLREPDPAGSDAPPALVVELAPMTVAPAIEQEAPPAEEVPPDITEPVEQVERLATLDTDHAVEVPPEPVEQPISERAEPVAEPSALVPDNVPETVEPERAAEAEPVDAEPVEAEAVAAESAEAVDAEPVEAEPVETEPVEAEPPEAKQEPLDEVVPDIVEAVAPEVLVPLPEPRPVEKMAAAKKIVEKAAPRKATPRKQKTAQPSKPAASAAAEAKTAPSGAAGISKPRISPASWKARVQSRLNRALRYPRAAEAQRVGGKALVSFAVDASGRVTSSRIARSSGNAELDRAALAMVQRASPLPAPPPELAGSSITVPAVFKPK